MSWIIVLADCPNNCFVATQDSSDGYTPSLGTQIQDGIYPRANQHGKQGKVFGTWALQYGLAYLMI